MEVTNSQAAAATSAATKDASKTVINSDFETFLKMLTAQLENQDPLNPLDSQDFAVQLATFSGVEQAVKTNDLLENLGTLFNTSELTNMGNLIGKEVRVKAAAEFSGQPIEVIPTYDPTADTNEIVVRDDLGRDVDRFIVDAKNTEVFIWTGIRDDGSAFPGGTYTFHVAGKANEEPVPETQAQIYARVVEARLDNGTAQLVLPGDIVVDQADIAALRAAN